MAKTKSKSRSEVEHLNGLVRQLKKHVKKLTKDNSKLRKELNKEPPKTDYNIEDIMTEEQSDEETCPSCGGVLNSIDLGVRIVVSCKECEYRKVYDGH